MAEVTRKAARRPRWWLGPWSTFRILLAPFGDWWCRSVDHLATAERQEAGLVIVLPGIEGRSVLNLDIARGLADGGIDCAVEVHDWTTGRLFNSLYHLRSRKWHELAADRLARRIMEYQDAHPGRPVVLVGHSGGAALTLLTLPLLADRQISGAVFLAAATSPDHDTLAARRRTRRGIWSFHSPFDWFQLGLGTLAVGTFDGKHTVSSGMFGFRDPPTEHPRDVARPSPDPGYAAAPAAGPAPLRQCGYRWAMARSWNFGGHHGWANRVFAAEWLAPVVLEASLD